MNGILPCDLSKRATPCQRQIEPDGSVTIHRLEGVADEVVHPYLGGTGGAGFRLPGVTYALCEKETDGGDTRF